MTKGIENTVASFSESKNKALIEILSSSPHSLTSEEISRRLKIHNVREPLHMTIQSLRELQSKGLVGFRAGKWESYMPMNYAAPEDMAATFSFKNSGKTSKNILDQSNNEQEKEKKTDWELFRKLCKYYVDCLDSDGGYSFSIFENELESRACFISGTKLISTRSNIRWSTTIATPPGSAEFLYRLTKKAEDEQCVIGYPIYVQKDQSKPGVESYKYYPIFTLAVKPCIGTGTINLDSDEVVIEVNSKWLNSQLNPEKRSVFLTQCGLFNRSIEDDLDQLISRDINTTGFDSLIKVLNDFFKNEIKETLNLSFVKNESQWRATNSGIYNRAAIFIGNRSNYNKTVIRELARISEARDDELEKTALKYIFTNSNLAIKEAEPSPVIDIVDLNEEQIEACKSILNQPATVISGPPGTGKSQVVLAAIISARYHDKSILFSCRNHKPIDAVVDRLNALDDKAGQIIIRSNPKNDSGRKPFKFKNALSQLQIEKYEQKSHDDWQKLKLEIQELLILREKASNELEKFLRLEEELSKIEAKKSSLLESWETPPIERLLNVQSVYLHLIGNKYLKLRSLEKKFDLKNSFLSRLKSIPLKIPKSIFIILLKHKLKSYSGIIDNFEDIEGEKKLRALLEYLYLNNKAKPKEREFIKIKAESSKETRIEAYRYFSKQIIEKSKQALELDIKRRIGLSPEEDKQSITDLRSALAISKNGMTNLLQKASVEKELMTKSPLVLKHFPAWAVTSASVGSSLPRVAGLYDFAIIDEASQCNIPNAIPILYRAKNVAVVGDPNQLAGISNLAIAEDLALRDKHGLNDLVHHQRFSYSDKSIYDLYAESKISNTVKLRKCYRSFFDIGEYCNQNFYNGDLETLTDETKLMIPKGKKPGIEWHHIDGEISKGISTGAVSTKEQIKIVEVLDELLVKNNFNGTVGVVAPFREQTLSIEKLVNEKFSYDIREKSKIQIATIDSFQGSEKDLMIFSLCLGPNMPAGSEAFIKKEARRLNVAVSRARAVLMIVGNRDYAGICGIPHIESLAKGDWELKYKLSRNMTSWAPHESPWEKILSEHLKLEGIITEPQYRVMGRRLDLAYTENNKKIDIEIDGATYHLNSDGTRKKDDIFRDLQLKAAGWKVLRFWVYELKNDMKGCIDKIKNEIEGVR